PARRAARRRRRGARSSGSGGRCPRAAATPRRRTSGTRADARSESVLAPPSLPFQMSSWLYNPTHPGGGCETLVKLILVATDESPTAARAVEWAGDMARRYGAE